MLTLILWGNEIFSTKIKAHVFALFTESNSQLNSAYRGE